VGDFVNDGEPELEEEAYSGRIPWVGHSTDDQNRCSTGLPASLVMAGHLLKLAGQTFEQGITDRKQRTSVSDWVDRLHGAADQTLACPHCTGTYFVLESQCPWCDTPAPANVPIRIVRWQPGKGIVEGAVRTIQLPLTREGLVLTRRITEGLTGPSGRTPHVTLQLVDRGVSVQVHGGSKAWVGPIGSTDDALHEVSDRARTIPLAGWMVFFEEQDKPQRVALIGRPA
jgi:hypothetical protein